MAVGFSGDVYIAAARAEEAGNGIEIAYSLPKEGTQLWFDMMAIPADAPNPEAAYKWMNFIMEPQITADITDYVSYANANKASLPLVDEAVQERSVDLPAGRGDGQALPVGHLRAEGRPGDHPALDQGADRAVAVTRALLAAAGLAVLAGPVLAEEIHVYNWSDYIGPDTIKRLRGGDRDQGRLRRL